MREVYRLAAGSLLLSCLVVFVAVPSLALMLGLAGRIYPAGPLGPTDIAWNLVALLPLSVPLAWALSRPDAPLPTRPGGGVPAGAALAIVLVWAAVYLASGGLDYRQVDLVEGVAARSPLLRVAQTLTSAIVVLGVAAQLSSRPGTLQRLSAGLCIVVPAVTLALAGGRGLVVQLLLTAWVARHLARDPPAATPAGLVPPPGAMGIEPMPAEPSAAAPSGALRRLRRQARRLLTLRAATAIATGVAVLALWGLARETEAESLSFSALFRAAEPYWHDAALMHQRQGFDPSVLADALERVLSIPGRWFGLEYASSIDGAERILEDRLGIPFVEGVSLPITFFGEGLLAAGHVGAAAFGLLAATLALASIAAARHAPLPGPSLMTAFLALQVVKCLFLYPKSLSGAVLVMVYETARDAFLLLLLTWPVLRRDDAR